MAQTKKGGKRCFFFLHNFIWNGYCWTSTKSYCPTVKSHQSWTNTNV